MSKRTKNKDEVYFSVCNAVLRLEVNRGHLKWTVSDLSRFSGITRSLIYYYFGKDKDDILEHSYRYMVGIFFNSDPNSKMGLHERLKKILSDLVHMPYIFVLYYLEKNKDSYFGKIIKKAESELLAHLEELYPKYSKEQVFELYLKELGAIAFQASSAQVESCFPDI